MWQLNNFSAEHICSFDKVFYELKQEQATLVFGNNMDSDSQNSNGSGKSALMEIISIGITGEPLRKVNMDEIINDAYDEAVICLILWNDEEKRQLQINRKISRKSPQVVQVIEQTGQYDDDVEEIKQATVADYNKYILDQIGLSKDDIFANFILTARKYKSFLACSDKEKKEIINRFSNGVIVDESIEALHDDMQPIQEELSEAEKKVAETNGRVMALTEEIERAINEADDKKKSRVERIESLRQNIVDNRAKIRVINDSISKKEIELNGIDYLDERMQNLEKSDTNVSEAYEVICKAFDELELAPITSYTEKANTLSSQLAQCSDKRKQLDAYMDDYSAQLAASQKKLDEFSADYEKRLNGFDDADAKIKVTIQKLTKRVQELRKQESELTEQRKTYNYNIANLEKQLAGVIQCPKCKHEFTLDADVDITSAREELKQLQAKVAQVESDIHTAQSDYDSCVADGKNAREQETTIAQNKSELQRHYNAISAELDNAKARLSSIQSNQEQAKVRAASIQRQIDGLRKAMFDEVFDRIDEIIKRGEAEIKNSKIEIESLQGAIKTYEDSISELENAANSDNIIDNLEASKAKYEKELNDAISKQQTISNKLNELKVQEATFLEFKTHLANSRIEAINQIINDFLETIGSDIRVALSGYSVTKTGKLRDKISVSLMRDGVDCGSFDKFSKGEQTRVELASILAMHKLTNVNTEEGKGLNLLVADEILDGSDETGLACIFHALNASGITSLVISHGSIAENYQNRLVVNKKNGISYL